MVKILFVCTGNICRSPTAEGVMRTIVQKAGLADKIEIDSAGTGSWHVGQAPDPRSQKAAKERGIDISEQRARKITTGDFETFDYVIALDQGNFENLQLLSPEKPKARISRLLTFTDSQNQSDVPDPFYGGPEAFEEVLDLIELGAADLLTYILKTDLQ